MKVWLNNCTIGKNPPLSGIPSHEQTKLLEIIEKNKEKFLYEWFEFKKREEN
jgi:hypothetical protein